MRFGIIDILEGIGTDILSPARSNRFAFVIILIDKDPFQQRITIRFSDNMIADVSHYGLHDISQHIQNSLAIIAGIVGNPFSANSYNVLHRDPMFVFGNAQQ